MGCCRSLIEMSALQIVHRDRDPSLGVNLNARRQRIEASQKISALGKRAFGVLVAIWSKLPLPFSVRLCSFFAGHL